MSYSGIESLLEKFRVSGVSLVNIDHHRESNYGDINIVDSECASTSIILYEVFDYLGVSVDKDMATSLLAGILVDTNSFSNSATSSESMEVASELVQHGGKYGLINRELYKNKERGWLEMWARVLSRLSKNDKLKVVYTVILREDFGSIDVDDLDGVANFFNHMMDADVSMVLREKESGEIKISLRSNNDKVDVSELARQLGGGGHKKAAGFSVYGRLEREGNGWAVV